MSGENMKTVKGFYFAAKARILRYGDGREIVVGETHSVDEPIELCWNGLHASGRLFDALHYAPGPILYRVELSGNIICGDDKMVATHRRYLAEFDAGDLLRRFVCDQALINIELIKPRCSEEDYDLIVAYLKTGCEDLRNRAHNACWHLQTHISVFDKKKCCESSCYALLSARCATTPQEDYEDYQSACSAINNAIQAQIALRYARKEAVSYASLKEESNAMLTAMVREATGWEI